MLVNRAQHGRELGKCFRLVQGVQALGAFVANNLCFGPLLFFFQGDLLVYSSGTLDPGTLFAGMRDRPPAAACTDNQTVCAIMLLPPAPVMPGKLSPVGFVRPGVFSSDLDKGSFRLVIRSSFLQTAGRRKVQQRP